MGLAGKFGRHFAEQSLADIPQARNDRQRIGSRLPRLQSLGWREDDLPLRVTLRIVCFVGLVPNTLSSL